MILVVKLAKDVQIKTVEQRRVLLLGHVAKEEAVVVDGEAIAGLGIPIPDHADAIFATVGIVTHGSHQVGFVFPQHDLGRELVAGSPRGDSVYAHLAGSGNSSANGNREPFVRLPAVTVIENRTVEGFFDCDSAVGSLRGCRAGKTKAGRRCGGGEEKISTLHCSGTPVSQMNCSGRLRREGQGKVTVSRTATELT